MTRRMKRVNVGAALGACIRARHEAQRLTQAELAGALEADIPSLSRLENGRRDLLVSELFAVAKALDVRPSTLVRSTEREMDSR
jgi:transcriptional regulator with XRE-family HTH domain